MAATPIFSSSSSATSASLMSYLLGLSVFLTLILSFLEKGFALEESQLLRQHAHTVGLNSLLPATSCSPISSAKGHERNESSSSPVLKVVHKHGPCSRINKNKSKTPTHAQILNQDQARVDSIHSRVNTEKSPSTTTVGKLRPSAATTIPAQSGSVVGSGDYIVNVGLGSPKKQLTLVFDTGSDLTWTQCRPCARSCYKQKEPIFDPATSSSYVNVSCKSATCSQLTSATGNTPRCSTTSACIYGIQYGDQSFSVGYFGKERLSVTSADVFDGFLFGCGHNNQGLFRGAAGLLGLGRNKISIVEQTALKYKRFFSYCLPSSSRGTGYLSFGKGGGSSKAVKFTPLADVSEGGSFYGLNVVGISVGGKKLPISSKVFSSSGTIIDSGTVITRLPATAYTALRDAFRLEMKSYKSAPAISILDTCYDFSSVKTVRYPKIAFAFRGGTTLDLDATGILYGVSAHQVCLAFAGNDDDSDIGIFGNIQQRRLHVVYDVGGRKIGFGPAGCP